MSYIHLHFFLLSIYYVFNKTLHHFNRSVHLPKTKIIILSYNKTVLRLKIYCPNLRLSKKLILSVNGHTALELLLSISISLCCFPFYLTNYKEKLFVQKYAHIRVVFTFKKFHNILITFYWGLFSTRKWRKSYNMSKKQNKKMSKIKGEKPMDNESEQRTECLTDNSGGCNKPSKNQKEHNGGYGERNNLSDYFKVQSLSKKGYQSESSNETENELMIIDEKLKLSNAVNNNSKLPPIAYQYDYKEAQSEADSVSLGELLEENKELHKQMQSLLHQQKEMHCQKLQKKHQQKKDNCEKRHQKLIHKKEVLTSQLSQRKEVIALQNVNVCKYLLCCHAMWLYFLTKTAVKSTYTYFFFFIGKKKQLVVLFFDISATPDECSLRPLSGHRKYKRYLCSTYASLFVYVCHFVSP
ncbi:hypothetical protein RFI_05835 [Reticulomyxa filosa]|uniref:Uncharacterized protein n=1 Tax=Reticulomyxa filosa TaxID=46433 RepID=X6NZL1_RETFI|nr:hypothetical protein RFI_05835 [Reticulomyxa filosa]|eukprot:ETO31284.1 hypothetical protein RFI_05835 [Reticulomyxa filosa]